VPARYSLLLLAARIEQMAIRTVETGMDGAQTIQGLACARIVFEIELCPRQTQHEGVVGRVDTGQTALEQPLGLGGTPAALRPLLASVNESSGGLPTAEGPRHPRRGLFRAL
jgi:hypothetical protein